MTTLTAVVREQIVAGVARGLFPAQAARVAGVADKTLHEWRRRGRAGEEPFAELEAGIQRAEAEMEGARLDELLAAGDWRAVAWFLERRFGVRWGQSLTLVVERQLVEAQAELLRVLERVCSEREQHDLFEEVVGALAQRVAAGEPRALPAAALTVERVG